MTYLPDSGKTGIKSRTAEPAVRPRLILVESRKANIYRKNFTGPKLARDKDRLDAYEDGMRVSQQALLALLDHSLDGNNVKQMEEAKDAIQKHLLNK